MINITQIEIYISHNVPTDYFRNLIVKYPSGEYGKNGVTNWFALVVKSETFDTNVKHDTTQVTLTWFAHEADENLMIDYHADSANYTP